MKARAAPVEIGQHCGRSRVSESETITIDGMSGEGGGQILRTSLCLSMITGAPVLVDNVRGGRRKPGLLRQHLTALQAAAEICAARVQGAEIGSSRVKFTPSVRPHAGTRHFAVGSAGSACLVLQTVLPALLVADGPSHLTLEGGTHNPWSPPFPFLEAVFFPLLRKMGAGVDAELVRPGFFPVGGGMFHVRIEPATLAPVEILERGAIIEKKAVALLSRLPMHIAERELATVQELLGWPAGICHVQMDETSPGPGNALMLTIASEHITECFTCFGERGRPAEAVAADGCAEVSAYLAAGVPVGPHLADQLLLPMALAGGGAFRTRAPTRHFTTNAEVIKQFMAVTISCERLDEDTYEVRIAGR